MLTSIMRTSLERKTLRARLLRLHWFLPYDYQFGDPVLTQDFRLTKTFTVQEKYKFSILGEVFNAFNISNLTYPSAAWTLDTKSANPATQTYAFGQPTQRVNQTFGSAGPRAFQVGARFTF